MITVLGGALFKLLKEAISSLIERVGILIEEDRFSVFRKLSLEALPKFLEHLIQKYLIELVLVTLGVFFIGWTLKIFAQDKQ